VHARHITVPNVVVGMALFYGGLAQFLAGMWEFAAGNAFGATGGFWPISVHPATPRESVEGLAISAITLTHMMCVELCGYRNMLYASQSSRHIHLAEGVSGVLRPALSLLFHYYSDGHGVFTDTDSCFSSAAFTSYGAFWLSFATLLIPNSGIGDAYSADARMEENAIGIYLLAWMIVTFLFLWVT
jgi:succinate-acetate transporter protein